MQNEEDCKLKVQKLEGYVHQLQSSKVGVIYTNMRTDFHTHTTSVQSELESEIEIAKVQYQEKAQQLQSLSTVGYHTTAPKLTSLYGYLLHNLQEIEQLSRTSKKYQALLTEHGRYA